MHATGSFTFGGFLFEGVTGDITTDDNQKYHFKGYAGAVGPPNVGYGTNFTGDFEGLDHIIGSCWLQLSDAGLGPGCLQLEWWDSHGQIGVMVGYVFGGGFNVGLGGGSWDSEEAQGLADGKHDLDALEDHIANYKPPFYISHMPPQPLPSGE